MMMRMASAIAIAALAGGCGSKVTGIVFTVDASGPVDGIARLHGTAALNGGAPAPIDLAHSPAVSIPPTTTFALQLPDSATGTVDVQLQALASDGTVLASGGGSAAIVPHGVQRNAQILLTPTGAGLVFDATMNDFGMIELAKSSAPFTFTATNMGMDQTGTPMVTIDGTDAGDFAFTTADCTNPIAAAGTCTIAVTFSPTAVGARSATLHLTATPGGEATAMLSGTGKMPSGAAFSIAPKMFLFNDTPEMTTGNSTMFTVTNIGGAASPTLGSSTIAGGMSTSYAITTDNCFAKVLQPNGTCTVTVQFKPVAAGMQSSTLTVAGAGATLNGRGQGTYHDEGSTHGGPGGGTFWYGAFAPSSDEIVATVTGNTRAYFMTPGMPATMVLGNVGASNAAQLRNVWGPAKASVYIVDDQGEVLHYAGGSPNFALFNAGNLQPVGCCIGIWGFSDTNFYVSGAATIAHYDGTWHTETVNATSPNLTTIWGSAPNNLYAVGAGGLIVHSTGNGTWTQMTSGTTIDLKAISGSSASDIYAVGYLAQNPAPSVILHYDGTSWKTQDPGVTNVEFNTVYVAPDGEVWVGDLLTKLLYSNGNGTWTNVSSIGNFERWQVTGTSDHDVYVFSEDGDILHYY